MTLTPSKLKKYVKYSEQTRRGIVWPGHFFFSGPLFLIILALNSFSVAALASETHDAVSQSSLYPTDLVEDLTLIAKSDSEELKTLQLYSTSIIHSIDEVVPYLDRTGQSNIDAELAALEQLALRWNAVRARWPHKVTNDEPFIPGSVLLEEIQLALERHITLWKLALRAERAGMASVSRSLYSKNLDDVLRLKAKTQAAEAFFLADGYESRTNDRTARQGSLWCDYLDTQSFLVELEACERTVHQPHRQVSMTASVLPVPTLISFSDRANVIVMRLAGSELSEVQKAYLAAKPVQEWKAELENWRTDTVSPRMLLEAVENFEATVGMSDMGQLFRLATRQSFSPSPELRRLGEFTRELYGLPNVKIYISNALINNHLPPMKPEVGSFRDVIQGQPTQGRRLSDSELSVSFLPDEGRLRFALDVDVSVETQSRSSAFATTLFNSGQARVDARKEIELNEFGFQLAPSDVRVIHNQLQLRRLQTEFDRIPLLSGLVRGVVKNQYDSKIAGARSETQQKIARQVRSRLDQEAEERFETLNERYRELRQTSMNHFGLFIEQKDAKTEQDWLLTSWAIRSQNCLSANTPAPETLPGSFADVKIHESVINMIVAKLELDGKSGSVGEIRQEIAHKFNLPQIDQPGENDDVQIAFADYNPVVVRFSDGKAEIRLAIKSLRLGRKTRRDFQVIVRYQPGFDSAGDPVLRRDGTISLLGCPRIGDQIPLRAAFGKIFPEERALPLTPKMLAEKPEFAYLSVAHCRIEKGWFALALAAKDDLNGRHQAAGTARTTLL